MQEESKVLLEKKEGDEEEGDDEKKDGDEKTEEEKEEKKETPSKGSSLLDSIRNVASHVPALFKKDKEKVN